MFVVTLAVSLGPTETPHHVLVDEFPWVVGSDASSDYVISRPGFPSYVLEMRCVDKQLYLRVIECKCCGTLTVCGDQSVLESIDVPAFTWVPINKGDQFVCAGVVVQVEAIEYHVLRRFVAAKREWLSRGKGVLFETPSHRYASVLNEDRLFGVQLSLGEVDRETLYRGPIYPIPRDGVSNLFRYVNVHSMALQAPIRVTLDSSGIKLQMPVSGSNRLPGGAKWLRLNTDNRWEKTQLPLHVKLGEVLRYGDVVFTFRCRAVERLALWCERPETEMSEGSLKERRLEERGAVGEGRKSENADVVRRRLGGVRWKRGRIGMLAVGAFAGVVVVLLSILISGGR